MLKSISSIKKGTYVGYTKNLKKRLHLHNNNKGARFTKGNTWEIIYKKKFLNKNDAMKYEYILKKNYNLRKKLKTNSLNNEQN